jgi:tetratricopeptide (TPR) repeat protein
VAWKDLPTHEEVRSANGARSEPGPEKLLQEAHRQFEREPQSAFAASQVLKCMREVVKAGGSPLPFLREARSIRTLFPEDPWVVRRFGWLCFDACKARLQAGEVEEATALLEEMTSLLPTMADSSGTFGKQVARLFGETVKTIKERPAKQHHLFARLINVGRTLYDTALPMLPTERIRGADGKEHPSACEIFLLRLRAAAEGAEEWEFLRGLCLEVINRRWPVADPKWFGKSLLEALCHIPTDEVVSETLNRFLLEHGDDEHIQVARAKWLNAQGNQAEAQAAFAIAVAIARSPWSWRDFAIFLGRKGDLEGARDTLSAALSWLDGSKPGLTWQIHFELARVLVQLGDWKEAATEARLARWCRHVAGWPADPKLEQFVQAHREQLRGYPSEAVQDNGAALLQQRLAVYRRTRETFLNRLAIPCAVQRANMERGLAWVRSVNGDERDALLRDRGRLPESGTVIQAILVPSWDRKKERPGLRVAWWRPAN